MPKSKPVTKKRNKKTASKKSATKRPPRTKGAFSVGAVVPTEKVEKRPYSRRGTIYQPILDEIQKIKPGQSLPVNVPEGVEAKVFLVRLSTAMRRFGCNAPEGCIYTRDVMVGDRQIAVSCLKL